MLDIQRLRTLIEVVERGTVVGAAQSLAYTPSAVSQQIAALERETGLQLFQRTSRGLRPTPAALVLVEHAARVLDGMREVDAAIEALRKGATGRMRVTAFQTASVTALPVATARFSARFPAVLVELSVSETDFVLDRVAAGELDLAVVIVPFEEQPTNARLAYHHLHTDVFTAVVSTEHARAAQDEISLTELQSEPWISTTGNPQWCDRIVGNACRVAGFEPNYAYHGDEYPMTQALVASGLGVALVPRLALAYGRHPGVVSRPLAGPPLQREIYAVTRAQSRPAFVDAYLSSLAEAFESFDDEASATLRSA